MERLIDKSALVAEIESKIKKYYKRGEESDALQDGYGMYWGGVLSCLNEVKTLINTLEVKDVDLEKEYEEFVVDDPILGDFITNDTMGMVLAKHFFELGLKTQHSNINFQNIDDLLEEDGINPDSKDAKIFKESYYMALEKLKEKKGE